MENATRDGAAAQNTVYKPMSVWMKVVLWLVVANAFGGAASLIISPIATNTTFFWKITPPIGSVMFGVMYLVAGATVLQSLSKGRWELARYLTPMIFSFTGLMLLTTFLHFDRLVPDARIYYWLAVYIIAPIAAIVFYIQHERGGANWQVVSQPVTPLVRTLAVAAGALFALFVVYGYLFPNVMIDIWPWVITPLMVHVFISWASAFAVGLLWFIVEPDWVRIRPVATMLITGAVLLLLVLMFYSSDLKPNAVSQWAFVAVLASGALLGAFMHLYQRSTVAKRQPALTQEPR